jgi:hypothetical protein
MKLSHDSATARAQLLERFPLGSSADDARAVLITNGFTYSHKTSQYIVCSKPAGKGLLWHRTRSVRFYFDQQDGITNVSTYTHTVKAWNPGTY